MELWKEVPGYEGVYSVSDLGAVRSEPRIVAHILDGKRLKGKVIRSRINKQTGYPTVNLCVNNKKKTFPVHVLVCMAFIGTRPEGFVIRHIDGSRLNSELSNLSYGTPLDNSNDSLMHGTTARGVKLNRAGLTEDDIRAIRLDKRLQKETAQQYGVNVTTISNIKNRIHWKHIE